ncbi:hypothetical protein C8R43DRAFT_209819 [Mycena crocata]|nr:hypothetical protein C8R43DRAFT_209819 [Mycena crocata]
MTQLNEKLANELNDAIILDVPGLVEHIFPDSLLPLAVDDLLDALTGKRGSDALFQLRKLRTADGSWAAFPVDENDDWTFATDLARFLNCMSETMRDVCRIGGGPLPKKKRRWTGAYAAPESLPLSGACLSEHPALVLFDGKIEEEGWQTSLAVGETATMGDYDLADSLNRLIHHGSDVFYNQDDRRFQIGFTISARTCRLVLVDHCGVVAGEFFDVDEEPELFVRLLAGLMFSSRPTIGFDTTITTLKNGQRRIKVGNDVYDIVARLAISHDVRGKATVCWHAQRKGSDFVIKDNWNDKTSLSEADILNIGKDIPGITKLITLKTVVIDRAEDSTAALRSIVINNSPSRGVRVHQRLVLTPLARKISYFRSRKELISVFIDVIKAHDGLVQKKILHCDISSNNIMIAEAAAETSTSIRNGILIDVDSALRLDNIGYWVGLVGTFVFMSSTILIHGSSTRQKPSDDYESFFWVLIYLSIRYAGPDNTTRADYLHAIHGLDAFNADQANALAVGRIKKQLLSTKGVLERDVFPRFSVYFGALKPCIAELRDAFMQDKNKFTCEAMLDVLRRTRDALPLVEDWSPQYDPVGYGLMPVSQKRRRDEEEEPCEPNKR